MMYHREAKSFPWAMSTYGIPVTFGVGTGATTEGRPRWWGEKRGNRTQGHYQVETGEDIRQDRPREEREDHLDIFS